MRKYIEKFLEEYNFSTDSVSTVLNAYDKIASAKNTEFYKIVEPYYKDYNTDMVVIYEKIGALAKEIGLHEYTAWLVLYIVLSERLKEYYDLHGISEEVFYVSMHDIKWKVDECLAVYGICGIFVPYWFIGFFKLERFGFIKLQFEIVNCKRDITVDGISLLDEPVINVHIPRTGERLDKESVDESYKKAADFFSARLSGKPIIFVCHSWLFYPKNLEILKPRSNLALFISDYKIAESKEYDDYSEVWRLFDTEYKGDVNVLPVDTSLRKAYVDWIKQGIPTGEGYGVYVYKKPKETIKKYNKKGNRHE